MLPLNPGSPSPDILAGALSQPQLSVFALIINIIVRSWRLWRNAEWQALRQLAQKRGKIPSPITN
jgi:hypothetical protein